MPKGVALSHMNLLSNVEQVRSHLALYETDILFNPLPTFHCFGLTVGSLMPLFDFDANEGNQDHRLILDPAMGTPVGGNGK